MRAGLNVSSQRQDQIGFLQIHMLSVAERFLLFRRDSLSQGHTRCLLCCAVLQEDHARPACAHGVLPAQLGSKEGPGEEGSAAKRLLSSFPLLCLNSAAVTVSYSVSNAQTPME
jgi:hypothetical protein